MEVLKERGSKFICSRADIALQQLPVVRVSTHFSLERGTVGCSDPSNIAFLPPFSVFNEGEKALRKKLMRAVVTIP